MLRNETLNVDNSETVSLTSVEPQQCLVRNAVWSFIFYPIHTFTKLIDQVMLL